MTVFLDTHAAVFVHSGDPGLLSAPALHMLNAASTLLISPVVVLEMQYLFEVGRIKYTGEQIAGFLHDQLNIQVDEDGLAPAVREAVACTWTRDPFDRIIASHAASRGAFLVTRDETIRDNYPDAVW